MFKLDNLQTIEGNTRKSKRIGRGFGSGKGGHNSSKGTKGQKARQGRKPHIWFEGGQTPLVRRLPFINGFKNNRAYRMLEINFDKLIKYADEKGLVRAEDVIAESKRTPDFVKILGTGTINKPINAKGFWFTKSAKEKIEKAGGSVE